MFCTCRNRFCCDTLNPSVRRRQSVSSPTGVGRVSRGAPAAVAAVAAVATVATVVTVVTVVTGVTVVTVVTLRRRNVAMRSAPEVLRSGGPGWSGGRL